MIRRRGLALAFALAACDGSLRFDQTPLLDAGAAACATSSDCPAGTPLCSPDHRCVQCVSTQDCASPLACETVSGQCNPRCHDEPDCPSATPTCDERHGVCAFCSSSDICASDEPVCHPSTGLCRKCSADAECPAARPRCDASGACVHCEADADCPTGTRCDSVLHDCVVPIPTSL